ncbi:MAG TPA: discoidin domain-containing protein [Candidatus Sulfotelmatobacter sp.]|nr:discoidin domain-containing protein [Candidatus Sulfotelmatobacter sp.]
MENGELQTEVKNTYRPPGLTGEHYLSCLRKLHSVLQPRTYLEIGTRHGESLKQARCAAIAVDPRFELNCRVPIESMPALCLFQTPSDRFFELYDPRSILKGPIDLAFLDGMHLMEYLLRDFIHTERACQKQSVIVLHDCVPFDYHMTRRVENDPKRRNLSAYPSWWTGDVWKVLPVLRRYRPDLNVEVFNAQPTGLVVVRGLDPNSRVLADHYDEIVGEFLSPVDEPATFAEFRSSLRISDTATLSAPGSLLGGRRLIATLLAKHPPRDFFRKGSELREGLLSQMPFEEVVEPMRRALVKERDHMGIVLLREEAMGHACSVTIATDDVACCKPAVSSSVSPWSRYQDPERDACGANSEQLSDDYGFHTRSEPDPWWMVDLLEEHIVEGVAIVNRRNMSERFRTFRIETSSDRKTWTSRFAQAQPRNVSSNPAWPWRVRFPDPSPARYVRIVLLGVENLHLRRVQVFGAPLSRRVGADRP